MIYEGLTPRICDYPNYDHFAHPNILPALNYLWEKERIGLLGKIILHTEKTTTHYRVRLTHLSPKIWERVIKPGLLKLVRIEHVDMFYTLNQGHCIDIGMEKKDDSVTFKK